MSLEIALNKSSVSVVIMTLNAQNFIEKQLEAIWNQTIKPVEVIVVDTESSDRTVEIAKQFNNTRIISIKRNEFNHGGSRAYAFNESVGDFVFFFTQDAVIEQIDYFEIMLGNFVDKKVAMVYARQLAKPDASYYERLIREFNYPNNRIVKDIDSIKTMGIKAYFMSNVCSCYSRDLYYKLGGFEKNIQTNEDMLIAARALRQGYKVVYEANATVKHSHNFSWIQEFRRNFDVGVFLNMYAEELQGTSEYGEGKKLRIYAKSL